MPCNPLVHGSPPLEEDCDLQAFGDDYSTTSEESSAAGYAILTMVMRGLRDLIGSEQELLKLQSLTPDGELTPTERRLYRWLGIPERHQAKVHGIAVGCLTGMQPLLGKCFVVLVCDWTPSCPFGAPLLPASMIGY